ncbi:MAG TPA: bifunctional ornithine acetyltransferase/N-acetylglutamate synthase [Solirubrobacterales bacterium]|nr:bifunctional ornithine acetyltransferase/N-acetylglutamate synthase [Solirubrobacterales bacterium]
MKESFFRSRWVQPPPGVEEIDAAQLAPGFSAGAVACGLKESGNTDAAVVVAGSERCASSLLLTRNAAAAAPVRLCRERCDSNAIRAAAVKAGNANAATGEQGMRDAIDIQEAAAEALGLDPSVVAVAATGKIGEALPMEKVLDGVRRAAGVVRPDGGEDFARAIMTTDAFPKRCTVRCDGVTLSAQAKGAGMIQPGYATMLCFIQTDAVLEDPDAILRPAVQASFERITVDGQMSTNDTVLLQGSGLAERPLPEGLLEAVLLQLALEIVADGEGATRTGCARVVGAASEEEAEKAARAIANSPLVKTALFGRDPNWGRIAQAAGMALDGIELPELGLDHIDATELGGEEREVEAVLRLGRGEHAAHVWFSDLGYEYVKLNAEYTT